MSKNTNLSFLTDFLTADIVNSRVGMNNVSPQATFDVTGTGKFSGVLTLGSTVSNGIYAYTLPSATGTLALTNDLSAYVTIGTNQTITGVKTFTQDILVNGLNIGKGAGNNSFNTAIGVNSLLNNSAINGTDNTAVGHSALSNNTEGYQNTAIGSQSLLFNTLGVENTAVGFFALNKNTSGNNNTAIGVYSLYKNLTGYQNTAVGYSSLSNNTTGIDNVSFGVGTLFNNTTGSKNTAFGSESIYGNTTGSENTVVGFEAGTRISAGTYNTITNNSVYIGYNTRANANNETNQIVIGHNAIGNGSNTVTIGNSSITNNYFTGNIRGGAFIKSGGTSSQFLKADGSVDSSSYGTGTVTSVAALTLGTTGTDLSSSVANGTTTPVITLNVPTASATNRGALSAADWTTFNNKASTSDLANYLPLTGGTLTGALNGTSASFTGTIASPLHVETSGADGGIQIYRNVNSDVGSAALFMSHKSTAGVINTANIEVVGSGSMLFRTGAVGLGNFGTTRLSINGSTGAATFSSSVTANSLKAEASGAAAFLYFNNTASPASNYIALGSAANELYFQVNGADRMLITSGGFIGIGTSGFSINNNLSLGRVFGFMQDINSGYIQANMANNGNYIVSQFAVRMHLDSAIGEITFLNAPSGTAGSAITLTPRLKIASNGNVLIGTTTDNGNKLQVNGGGNFLGTVSSGNGLVNGYKGFQGSTGQFNTSTGLILLGSANPGNGYIIEFQAPDGSYNYATRGAIELSGVSILYSNFSDYRLKTNIKPLGSALERISNLKPVRFNLLADMKNTIDGFLAHEVQEVVPEAVNRNKDAVKENGEPDYQSLDQSKLIPLLTAAIQELKAELDELKSNN